MPGHRQPTTAGPAGLPARRGARAATVILVACASRSAAPYAGLGAPPGGARAATPRKSWRPPSAAAPVPPHRTLDGGAALGDNERAAMPRRGHAMKRTAPVATYLCLASVPACQRREEPPARRACDVHVFPATPEVASRAAVVWTATL
jgi:hypothetical protein